MVRKKIELGFFATICFLCFVWRKGSDLVFLVSTRAFGDVDLFLVKMILRNVLVLENPCGICFDFPNHGRFNVHPVF